MKLASDFFRNREDAEDAVQEVLIKIWLRKWQPGDNIDGLAVRAIKNQCVSMQRKLLLRRTADIDDEARRTAASEESDTNIRTEEQHETIERAIGLLPRSEQRLIRMKQKGLEADEITLITGIPLHSVRTILSAARKKLIKQLKT